MRATHAGKKQFLRASFMTRDVKDRVCMRPSDQSNDCTGVGRKLSHEQKESLCGRGLKFFPKQMVKLLNQQCSTPLHLLQFFSIDRNQDFARHIWTLTAQVSNIKKNIFSHFSFLL